MCVQMLLKKKKRQFLGIFTAAVSCSSTHWPHGQWARHGHGAAGWMRDVVKDVAIGLCCSGAAWERGNQKRA